MKKIKNIPIQKKEVLDYLNQKIEEYNIKDDNFLQRLRFDFFLSFVYRRPVLDPYKTELEFSKYDAYYDPENSTYKDKPISFYQYIYMKYGKNYAEFLKSLF